MRRAIVVAFVAVWAWVVLVGPAVPLAAEVKMRFAGNLPPANSNSKAMEVFKEEVARLSGGQIRVDTFPGMQLGGAKENVDMTKSGSLEATYVGVAFLTGFVPKLNLLNLPFAWKDRHTAFVVLDGPIGKELEGDLNRAGFKLIGFWENGWRHITNSKRPIRTPEDLKGIKIRVQPAEVYLKTFRAFGANPGPMDIKEVYSALQQGVMDAQENPFANIYNLKFYEVQKYLTVAGYTYDLMGAVMHKRFFDTLAPEHQRAVDAAARTATVFQRRQAEAGDAVALENLKKAGMQVNVLTPQELALFQERVKGVYKEFEKDLGKDLIERFLAANR